MREAPKGKRTAGPSLQSGNSAKMEKHAPSRTVSPYHLLLRVPQFMNHALMITAYSPGNAPSAAWLQSHQTQSNFLSSFNHRRYLMY
jgi:hypothetical protein